MIRWTVVFSVIAKKNVQVQKLIDFFSIKKEKLQGNRKLFEFGTSIA